MSEEWVSDGVTSGDDWERSSVVASTIQQDDSPSVNTLSSASVEDIERVLVGVEQDRSELQRHLSEVRSLIGQADGMIRDSSYAGPNAASTPAPSMADSGYIRLADTRRSLHENAERLEQLVAKISDTEDRARQLLEYRSCDPAPSPVSTPISAGRSALSVVSSGQQSSIFATPSAGHLSPSSLTTTAVIEGDGGDSVFDAPLSTRSRWDQPAVAVVRGRPSWSTPLQQAVTSLADNQQRSQSRPNQLPFADNGTVGSASCDGDLVRQQLAQLRQMMHSLQTNSAANSNPAMQSDNTNLLASSFDHEDPFIHAPTRSLVAAEYGVPLESLSLSDRQSTLNNSFCSTTIALTSQTSTLNSLRSFETAPCRSSGAPLSMSSVPRNGESKVASAATSLFAVRPQLDQQRNLNSPTLPRSPYAPWHRPTVETGQVLPEQSSAFENGRLAGNNGSARIQHTASTAGDFHAQLQELMAQVQCLSGRVEASLAPPRVDVSPRRSLFSTSVIQQTNEHLQHQLYRQEQQIATVVSLVSQCLQMLHSHQQLLNDIRRQLDDRLPTFTPPSLQRQQRSLDISSSCVHDVLAAGNTSAPALNNQVAPGLRANNYWDNFRSYSRQNQLSPASGARCQSFPVPPLDRDTGVNALGGGVHGASVLSAEAPPTDLRRMSDSFCARPRVKKQKVNRENQRLERASISSGPSSFPHNTVPSDSAAESEATITAAAQTDLQHERLLSELLQQLQLGSCEPQQRRRLLSAVQTVVHSVLSPSATTNASNNADLSPPPPARDSVGGMARRSDVCQKRYNSGGAAGSADSSAGSVPRRRHSFQHLHVRCNNKLSVDGRHSRPTDRLAVHNNLFSVSTDANETTVTVVDGSGAVRCFLAEFESAWRDYSRSCVTSSLASRLSPWLVLACRRHQVSLVSPTSSDAPFDSVKVQLCIDHVLTRFSGKPLSLLTDALRRCLRPLTASNNGASVADVGAGDDIDPSAQLATRSCDTTDNGFTLLDTLDSGDSGTQQLLSESSISSDSSCSEKVLITNPAITTIHSTSAATNDGADSDNCDIITVEQSDAVNSQTQSLVTMTTSTATPSVCAHSNSAHCQAVDASQTAGRRDIGPDDPDTENQAAVFHQLTNFSTP